MIEDGPASAGERRRSACAARRGFLAASCAGLAALGLPGLARATLVTPAPIRFEILRKGDVIGTHGVRFEPTAGGLLVRTEIDIVVKVAFITAFRFSQSATDQLENDILVATEIETDDNGETSRLVGRRDGGVFRCEGPAGPVEVDLGTLTDHCWWKREIVNQNVLLDGKEGVVADVTTRKKGSGTVEVAGSSVPAEGFAMRASRGREGVIWYDDEDRWVRADMTTRGEHLSYRLIV